MTHGINFQQVKNSLPIAIASTAKIVSVLIPKESFVITPLTKSEKLNSLRFLTCVCLIETTTSQNRFVFCSQWDADCACDVFPKDKHTRMKQPPKYVYVRLSDSSSKSRNGNRHFR